MVPSRCHGFPSSSLLTPHFRPLKDSSHILERFGLYDIVAMFAPIFLAALLSAISTVAVPHRPHQRATTLTTDVTYYQGSASTAGSCGEEAVATGNITSGTCATLYTYALSIQPLADQDCEYLLYEGSSDCGSDATTTLLPAGGLAVCVTTGVLDGGEFMHASGTLKC